MRPQLHIEVTDADVRATLESKAGTLWSHAEPIGESGIGEPLRALLGAMPARRGRARHRMRVSLAEKYVQVRRIEGLPALPSVAMLSQIVRQNPDAFFLRRFPRVVISDLHRCDDHAVFGAAFDATVLTELATVAAECSATIAAISPTVLPDIVRTGQRAGAGRSIPLSWVPPMPPAQAQMRRRVRVIVSGVAAAAVAAFAIAAPAVRASRQVRIDSAKLAQLRSVELAASRSTGELNRVSQTLDAVAGFAAERGQISALLGELSRSIPDSTALLSFRVDSAEGTFVALSPHAMEVLPSLGGIEGVAMPRMAGAITREVIAGARLERATFRFRRAGRATPTKSVKR